MRGTTHEVVLPVRGPAIVIHTSSNDDMTGIPPATVRPTGNPRAPLTPKRFALAATAAFVIGSISLPLPAHCAASSPRLERLERRGSARTRPVRTRMRRATPTPPIHQYTSPLGSSRSVNNSIPSVNGFHERPSTPRQSAQACAPRVISRLAAPTMAIKTAITTVDGSHVDTSSRALIFFCSTVGSYPTRQPPPLRNAPGTVCPERWRFST